MVGILLCAGTRFCLASTRFFETTLCSSWVLFVDVLPAEEDVKHGLVVPWIVRTCALPETLLQKVHACTACMQRHAMHARTHARTHAHTVTHSHMWQGMLHNCYADYHHRDGSEGLTILADQSTCSVYICRMSIAWLPAGQNVHRAD